MIRRIADGATFFVIDAHAHTGESSLLRRYRYKGSNKFQVDDLIERMDRHGIDAAITFAHHSPNTGYGEQNELILAAAVEHPTRVIPFIRLSPHRQENLADRIRDYARKGARGIKLHPFLDAFPINDALLVRPIIDAAQENGLVVLFHCGEAWTALPGLVLDLALDYPDVQFVMGHGGHRGFDIEATALAKRSPNIWVETSVLYPPNRVSKLVDGVGYEKVIFGSDTSIGNMTAEVEKLLRFSGLSVEALTGIFGRNAARMLGLNPDAMRLDTTVDYPLEEALDGSQGPLHP